MIKGVGAVGVPRRRTSANQREALAVLRLLSLRRPGQRLFPFKDLLKVVNESRWEPVARQNFYVGLRSLSDRGLIQIYRDGSQVLHAALTEEGAILADAIIEEMSK